MNCLFEIVKTENKGKIVVAAVDLLPGVELVREDPILCVSIEDEQSPKNKQLERLSSMDGFLWATYDEFKKLSPENKEAFMSMYGGEETHLAMDWKQALSKSALRAMVNVDEFVAIALRMFLNHISYGSGHGAYPQGARFSHSCFPNCVWDQVELFDAGKTKTKYIRTIRSVKKGEELTVCYNLEFEANPIRDRRKHYMSAKEFLCRCERCNNPADDTRRFACCAGDGCIGFHCVCQPLASDEPSFLPCSRCGIQPSVKWQANMLSLEKREIAKINNGNHDGGFFSLIEPSLMSRACGYRDKDETLYTANPLPLPLHYTAIYFLLVKMEAAESRRDAKALLKFAKQYLALQDHMLKFPCRQLYMNGLFIGGKVENVDTIEALQMAATAYQAALYQIVMINDQMVDKSARANLVKVMIKLRGRAHPHFSPNKLRHVECCGLCGACPSEMAITLSFCSACDKEMYCSRGCQVAHWKIHKTECKTSI